MEKKNDWEMNVENTLDSLNGISRAKANPFLYTRIRARLDEQQGFWSKSARFLSQPAFALSAAILFISLNVGVAVKNQTQQANEKVAEVGKAFDAEYATINYSLENLNDK